MSDPLTTRAVLRRQICKANGMRFSRSYYWCSITSIEHRVDGGGIPRTIIKSSGNLRENPNYWKGAWVLITSGNGAGTFRKIVESNPKDSQIVTERTFPANKVAVGDTFEILDWSPGDVHNAINRAINDGYRAFPYVTDYDSLIIQEKTLEYDLSDIPIWIPVQVWLERASSTTSGTITHGRREALLDNNANWDVNEHVGKLVSLYAGTGAGQIKYIISNTATGLTFVDYPYDPAGIRTGVWKPVPDTTTKYRIWDPSIQNEEWYRLPAGRFFPDENPERFYLTRNYPDYYGLRMRIVYMPGPTPLHDDDDTTRINSEYITYKASSVLHDMLVSDSTVNRSAHASIAEYMDRLARDILERHRKTIPPFNMWIETDDSDAAYREEEMWRPW